MSWEWEGLGQPEMVNLKAVTPTLPPVCYIS